MAKKERHSTIEISNDSGQEDDSQILVESLIVEVDDRHQDVEDTHTTQQNVIKNIKKERHSTIEISNDNGQEDDSQILVESLIVEVDDRHQDVEDAIEITGDNQHKTILKTERIFEDKFIQKEFAPVPESSKHSVFDPNDYENDSHQKENKSSFEETSIHKIQNEDLDADKTSNDNLVTQHRHSVFDPDDYHENILIAAKSGQTFNNDSQLISLSNKEDGADKDFQVKIDNEARILLKKMYENQDLLMKKIQEQEQIIAQSFQKIYLLEHANKAFNTSGEEVRIKDTAIDKSMQLYNNEVIKSSAEVAKSVNSFCEKKYADPKERLLVMSSIGTLSSRISHKFVRGKKRIIVSKNKIKKSMFNIASGLTNMVVKSFEKAREKANLSLMVTKNSLNKISHKKAKEKINNAYNTGTLATYKTAMATKEFIANKTPTIGPKTKLALGGLALFTAYHLGAMDSTHGIIKEASNIDYSYLSNANPNTDNITNHLAHINYASFTAPNNPTVLSNFHDTWIAIADKIKNNDMLNFANNKFNSLMGYINEASSRLNNNVVDAHQSLMPSSGIENEIVNNIHAHSAQFANETINNTHHHLSNHVNHIHHNLESISTDKLNEISLNAAKHGYTPSINDFINASSHQDVASATLSHANHAQSLAEHTEAIHKATGGSINAEIITSHNGSEIAKTNLQNGHITQNNVIENIINNTKKVANKEIIKPLTPNMFN